MSTTTETPLTNALALKVVANLRSGPSGFNAIARATGAANPPALSCVLKKMTRDGLIVRTVYELGPPAKTAYNLTPLGHDLAKVSAPLVDWVAANVGTVRANRDYARSIGFSVRRPRTQLAAD
jgi:DNA-binding HxlR family transcriptional regulator